METLWQDVRYGVRVLVRTPRFTLGAVAALALAIGANTAIFSLVNTILLQQLSFDSPEQLVAITSIRPDKDDAPFALPEYMDYRDQNRSFQELAAYGTVGMNLTGVGDPERLQGIRASANIFVTLGTHAHLGRTLQPDDDLPSNSRVVVISYGLWQRRFGGDPRVVGRPLLLGGTSYELVGILPPNFLFPDRAAEFAVPLVPDADPWRRDRNSVNFLRPIGRLKRGVSLAQAREDMNAICTRLREQFPVEQARDIAVGVTSLHETLVKNYRRSLWVLLGAMGLVLLTACANLANLLLTRASARRKELALRGALGAPRLRLARQLITEGTLLALAGGAGGLLLATQGVQFLLRFAPPDLPRIAEVRMDAAVMGWTLGISMLAGLLFSLAPALQASKTDVNESLRDTGRGLSDARRVLGLRNLLVVVEVAIATILLVGGGLLIQSFQRLQGVHPGFEPKGLLVARLSLPAAGYPTPEAVHVFYEKLRARLLATPGVESASVVSLAPMTGLVASVPFTEEGRPPAAPDQVPSAQYRMISPGYARTMGIPIIQGREFQESDTFTTQPVVLVNQTLARQFFPDGDAVGKRLRIDDTSAPPRAVQIVGVIGDVKQSALDRPPAYDIYITVGQLQPSGTVWIRNNMFWMLRTKQNPAAQVNPFRAALREVASDVPASSVQPMEQYLSAWMAPRRFNLQLLSVFAVAGLLLATSGIYAVISYSVALRTKEIGIRMALGAQKGAILSQIAQQGALLALVGVIAGLAGAITLGRVMRGLLFAVEPLDLTTYAVVAALLVTASLLACCLPALRATRIDPLLALRHE